MTDTFEPNWYPDPLGRHELRYYDGSAWTDHVVSGGRQQVDPPHAAPANAPQMTVDQQRLQRQVHESGAVTGAKGGGTLFTEPVLVVNQKAKIIEVNNEYGVFDQNGNQLGVVRQVGQSKAKKVARVLTSYDQFMTHNLQVVDIHGNVVMALTRPAKVFKSRIIVNDAHSRELGAIIQQNVFGKIRFSLEAGGHQIGSLNAENWRAWNFSICDHEGGEVARITKKFVGLAKAMFTSADNYVVQIHRPLEDPLRSLVVASALSVDTALKQDARGLG